MEPSLSYQQSQPLLSPSSAGGQRSFKRRNGQFLRDICVPSRAGVLLVCLAVVLGTMHALFTCVLVFSAIYLVGGKYLNESVAICIPYLAMAMAVVLYPVCGFIADVILGRYRAFCASMCLISISVVFMLGADGLILVDSDDIYPLLWSHSKTAGFFVLFSLFGAFLALVGSAIIQISFYLVLTSLWRNQVII